MISLFMLQHNALDTMISLFLLQHYALDTRWLHCFCFSITHPTHDDCTVFASALRIPHTRIALFLLQHYASNTRGLHCFYFSITHPTHEDCTVFTSALRVPHTRIVLFLLQHYASHTRFITMWINTAKARLDQLQCTCISCLKEIFERIEDIVIFENIFFIQNVYHHWWILIN